MTDEMPQSGPSLDELLDAVLFAPIGLTLHCLENYPELAERGRRQVRFARSLGKMAFAAASSTRTSTGSKAPAAASTTESASAAPNPAPARKSGPGSSTTRVAPAETPATARATTAPKAAAGEAGTDPTVLTAKDAIAAIATMSASELTAARKLEKAGKGRITVLRAIDSRRSGLS